MVELVLVGLTTALIVTMISMRELAKASTASDGSRLPVSEPETSLVEHLTQFAFLIMFLGAQLALVEFCVLPVGWAKFPGEIAAGGLFAFSLGVAILWNRQTRSLSPKPIDVPFVFLALLFCGAVAVIGFGSAALLCRIEGAQAPRMEASSSKADLRMERLRLGMRPYTQAYEQGFHRSSEAVAATFEVAANVLKGSNAKRGSSDKLAARLEQLRGVVLPFWAVAVGVLLTLFAALARGAFSRWSSRNRLRQMLQVPTLIFASLSFLPWGLGLLMIYVGGMIWPQGILHLWFAGLGIGVAATVGLLTLPRRRNDPLAFQEVSGDS